MLLSLQYNMTLTIIMFVNNFELSYYNYWIPTFINTPFFKFLMKLNMNNKKIKSIFLCRHLKKKSTILLLRKILI